MKEIIEQRIVRKSKIDKIKKLRLTDYNEKEIRELEEILDFMNSYDKIIVILINRFSIIMKYIIDKLKQENNCFSIQDKIFEDKTIVQPSINKFF